MPCPACNSLIDHSASLAPHGALSTDVPIDNNCPGRDADLTFFKCLTPNCDAELARQFGKQWIWWNKAI